MPGGGFDFGDPLTHVVGQTGFDVVAIVVDHQLLLPVCGDFFELVSQRQIARQPHQAHALAQQVGDAQRDIAASHEQYPLHHDGRD